MRNIFILSTLLFVSVPSIALADDNAPSWFFPGSDSVPSDNTRVDIGSSGASVDSRGGNFTWTLPAEPTPTPIPEVVVTREELNDENAANAQSAGTFAAQQQAAFEGSNRAYDARQAEAAAEAERRAATEAALEELRRSREGEGAIDVSFATEVEYRSDETPLQRAAGWINQVITNGGEMLNRNTEIARAGEYANSVEWSGEYRETVQIQGVPVQVAFDGSAAAQGGVQGSIAGSAGALAGLTTGGDFMERLAGLSSNPNPAEVFAVINGLETAASTAVLQSQNAAEAVGRAQGALGSSATGNYEIKVAGRTVRSGSVSEDIVANGALISQADALADASVQASQAFQEAVRLYTAARRRANATPEDIAAAQAEVIRTYQAALAAAEASVNANARAFFNFDIIRNGEQIHEGTFDASASTEEGSSASAVVDGAPVGSGASGVTGGARSGSSASSAGGSSVVLPEHIQAEQGEFCNDEQRAANTEEFGCKGIGACRFEIVRDTVRVLRPRPDESVIVRYSKTQDAVILRDYMRRGQNMRYFRDCFPVAPPTPPSTDCAEATVTASENGQCTMKLVSPRCTTTVRGSDGELVVINVDEEFTCPLENCGEVNTAVADADVIKSCASHEDEETASVEDGPTSETIDQ